jgi:exodeoxyribonuclease V alpha subunit
MLILSHPITELLHLWQQQRLITALDRHFALELANIETINNDPSITEAQSQLFLLICALLSQQLSNQHSCLVVDQIDLGNPMAEDSHRHAEINCAIKLNHQQLIEQICLFDAVGQPGDNTPMIFEHGRLYLNKYHFFETQVAAKLTQLANQPIDINVNNSTLDNTNLPQLIECLFTAENSHNSQFNWQKIATATALVKALAVITGGPGTGKTTTVTKLLLLLLTQSALTIRLVAPTGKAAARLSESIKASKQRLLQELTQVTDPALAKILIDSLKQIPEDASTLHRLLGVIPNSHQFRHHQHNPLRLDLLVVDEASMVDLPMMYKLLSALPPHGRLILLGDQDQLASVEAGAVLADICVGLKQSRQANSSPWSMRYSAAQAKLIEQLTQQDVSQFIDPQPKIGDSLCMLMHSHRFKGDRGIGLLASAVNQSNVNAIRQVWQHDYAELNWFEHQHNAQGDNSGKQALLALSVHAYGEYLSLVQENQQRINQQTILDPADVQDSVITLPHSEQTIIDSFNHYRVLCAMRAGEFGVEGMNIAITDSLKQIKLINPQNEFYLGRPIIIQSNDYNLGLFNGDIGLILQDSTKPSRLMAHFVMADGSLLKVLPARLPSHDTCYAMTVHKSQGSEFDKVSFVLPHKPSPAQWQLLSKELLYTAITRAKNHFYCLGTNMIFEKASKQATSRASGLAWRLWG